MKKYVYESSLSPEEVRERLEDRTRPMEKGWMLEEHQAFAKFLTDGRFYLAKTCKTGQLRTQLPFVGTVAPAEGGSVITGAFLPPKSMKTAMLGMILAAMFICCGFTGGDLLAVAKLVAGLAVWCVLVWVLLVELPVLNRQQNQATLAFIEENLLSE